MLAWTFQYLNNWPKRMQKKFDPNVKMHLIERSILSTRRFSNFACRLSRLSSKANVLPSKRRESDVPGPNYSTRDTIKSNSFSSSKAAFI
ncbi:Oidioi.mRNA.OKI2018_I69.chr2.g5658.t1.cds [Oikopleura dioica]|uniref:Oidioi.mRNA.OKI2018_I69.chr2.g5658.t1.cds n=1 Tax=Oikopleura dioica TaxID=34765 RepID=A0ABN7T144_OIKDI|nr:Oidioi.mRNA.OKI2018_I69.chr2.g5658.t1.cds [Oikopleura dioica]